MLKITVLLLVAVLPYLAYAGLVGGQVTYTTTLDDPNIVFAVQAINDYYKKLGDNQLRTAVKLVEATSQVVAGAMYRFKLEVTNGSTVEECTVAVWSRPWLTGDDATRVEGEPHCVAAA
ncbi:hypothetical protein Btru_039506 [Bulinus truncatus]|nr:hypothetical protein Btru_039506 [Bulinus truncatus]